jgi:protein-S-isoprenylcysteine O-methyltransferase Ste14
VGIGTSIFLIAVGAILRYAVTGHVEGVDLDVVGLILMIVGVVGLVVTFLWMTMWADRRRGAVVREPVREREVVERDPY